MQLNIETLELSEWPKGWLNIQWMIFYIRLTYNALFQYWFVCQPDLHTHPVNIESTMGPSTIIPVFQYSITCQPDLYTHPLSIGVGSRPVRLFSCWGIGLDVGRIYTLIHWLLGQPSALRLFRCFMYIPHYVSRIFNLIHSIWGGRPQKGNVSILDCMSAWCMRLIHRVLGQGSATPTVPVFQYPITSLYNHPLSIGSSVSHCDNSCVPIFDSMSAWFMHSSIEYWVKILPLWPIWSSNIDLYVSLISILVMWHWVENSATPTIPLFQYSILCNSDL